MRMPPGVNSAWNAAIRGLTSDYGIGAQSLKASSPDVYNTMLSVARQSPYTLQGPQQASGGGRNPTTSGRALDMSVPAQEWNGKKYRLILGQDPNQQDSWEEVDE